MLCNRTLSIFIRETIVAVTSPVIYRSSLDISQRQKHSREQFKTPSEFRQTSKLVKVI